VTTWTIARHRVAIAGLVVDGATGKPISGAHVEIVGKPAAYEEKLALLAASLGDTGREIERPDAARTRPDGLFYFLDLPEGRYRVIAFLPKEGLRAKNVLKMKKDREGDPYKVKGDKRYGKTQEEVTVSYKDGFGKLIFFKLQPTGVTGRVIGAANKAAVLLAEVRVQGSGERAFTDGQGHYTVAGVQPNQRAKRRLLVSARGYRTEHLEVMVDEPGACKKIEDIKLSREGG
jgi:carboxypeptidase family protein